MLLSFMVKNINIYYIYKYKQLDYDDNCVQLLRTDNNRSMYALFYMIDALLAVSLYAYII